MSSPLSVRRCEKPPFRSRCRSCRMLLGRPEGNSVPVPSFEIVINYTYTHSCKMTSRCYGFWLCGNCFLRLKRCVNDVEVV